jgi:predicted small secreted protein
MRIFLHYDFLHGAEGFPRCIPKMNKIEEHIMLKKTIASLLAALFLTGALASLTGCNTVEGAGKDIEKGGSAIKEEAQEHK